MLTTGASLSPTVAPFSREVPITLEFPTVILALDFKPAPRGYPAHSDNSYITLLCAIGKFANENGAKSKVFHPEQFGTYL